MSILDLQSERQPLEALLRGRSLDQVRQHEDRPPERFFHNERQELFQSVGPDVSDLGITRIARVRFNAGAHVGDNGFRRMTRFACVISGEARFLTPSPSAHLKPGMFFSRPARVANSLIVTGGIPFCIWVVCCEGPMSLSLHQTLLGRKAAAFTPQHPAEVQSAFAEMLADAGGQSQHSQRIAACQLEILLRKLNPHASANPAAARPQAYATFLRCRHYITRHAPELVSAGDIAEACAVDASYLGRLFKQFEQMSTYQFLMRMKMNHAGELLLNSSHSVQEIADQLGFSDAFTFSRAFKRIQGRSPRDYRRDR